ncbi:MAG TPA: GNAT family N-acetyltransferase [Gemmatimonadaceae bacterium]|nr:GNAT family N-acetyltransferase [Gemmatimonadaceae bacterium]
MSELVIEEVDDVSDEVVQGLAELLVDAIESGAGISFMSGLRAEDAAEWWRKTLSTSSPRAVILIARDAEGILGTVQLQPAWAPNQPHRADVAKLIVHRRARGRGIARALMHELESQARARKFSLLLLDTCQGSAAEQLYTSLGWVRVGVVPRFALNPDGSPCDTVFFYKEV